MKLGKLFKGKPKQKKTEDEPEGRAGSDPDVMDADRLMAMGSDARVQAAEAAAIQEALANVLPDGVELKSRVKYEDGLFKYFMKITNNTNDIMGDVKVAIAADERLVSCDKPRQSSKFIDPGQSHLFKFPMQPTMVCGKTEIQGLLRYFDFSVQEKQEFLIPEYDLNISCPIIESREVDEDYWRISKSHLEVYEIETDDLNFEPHKVFSHMSKIVEKLGFYQLEPVVVPTIYRGIAKFYGDDPLKEPHCVEVQVIGQDKNTKILFRVWAPTTTRAMGIAFKVLGKVDKRLAIRENIVKGKSDN
jgi:hypothetical protein